MGRATCTVSEVLISCLKITADKQTVGFSRDVGSCLRALGWKSKVVRAGDDKKPTKVFLSPEEQKAPGSIPGAIGPQEDVAF
jgi:hypothetical protein